MAGHLENCAECLALSTLKRRTHPCLTPLSYFPATLPQRLVLSTHLSSRSSNKSCSYSSTLASSSASLVFPFSNFILPVITVVSLVARPPT